MPRIFISYRREDAQWPVDRIHMALKPHVADPHADIFVDVDNIPVGVDFAQYLDSKVAQCDVLLAVIGPDWLKVTNPRTGARRLDDPKDFVRIEIASALKRGIPVAPVMLDDTPVPDAVDLPDDLKPLANRQAVDVRRMTFDADVQRLIRGLGLAPAASPSPLPEGTARPKVEPNGGGRVAIGVALLVLVIAGAGAWGWTQGWFGSPPRPAEAAAEPSTAAAADIASGAADDDAAWRLAADVDQQKGYNSYLRDYASGAHAAEARAALAKIADEADWAKAAGGDRSALDAYLSAHGAGAHAAEAREALGRLDTAEKAAAAAKSEQERQAILAEAARQRDAAQRKADGDAWAIASGANTLSAYRTYLDRYPSGAYASNARTAINTLSVAPKPTAAPSAGKYDVALLHPDVRTAVLAARDAKAKAEAAAARARTAASQAEDAGKRARSREAGYQVQTSSDQTTAAQVSSGDRTTFGVQDYTSGNFVGDHYAGGWQSGRKSGVGVYSYAQNANNAAGASSALRYEGEMSDSKYNGVGVVLWRDGVRHAGGQRDSQKSGPGVLDLPDGRRYEGDWANDRYNGYGVFWDAQGQVTQAGIWTDNKLTTALRP